MGWPHPHAQGAIMSPFTCSTDEITIDMFAGAGGASCGLEMAGIHVHAAINHDPIAVGLHARNHPYTEHHVEDVYTLSPLWVTRGRPVGLLWMSPDCTHHSKAKGGVPTRDERRRELAMVLVDKWIPELGQKAPRIIILENVEEFADWGPLDRDGNIIASAKGERFQTFIRKLRRYGYRVEYRELRACDYGAPTIRKRLFLIARRDKEPILWPEPTYAAPDSLKAQAGTLLPWRTAAECIDWSIPCPSIFATSVEIWEQYGVRSVRPLAENTLRRIAKGVQRYVLDNPSPYIVSYYGQKSNEFRGCSLDSPLPTQTTENRFAVITPYMQHVQEDFIHAAYMVKMRGKNIGDTANAPLHTISAGGTHHALCTAFLSRQFGQTIANTSYAIVDIGMRMLTPRELARAQGFPDWYVLDEDKQGRPITKTDQVRGIGNSVCPPIARALAGANYTPCNRPAIKRDMPLFFLPEFCKPAPAVQRVLK